MIGSPQIDKVIRRQLSPIVREHGFSHVKTRKNFGWYDCLTWVLEIRAVGNHFARVSQWPSMSVTVSIGVFFDFESLGALPIRVKRLPDGKPVPEIYHCHWRSHLNAGIDQSRHTYLLENRADHGRVDVWWIEPEGGNLEDVIADIGAQFLANAVPWFAQYKDAETAFAVLLEQSKSEQIDILFHLAYLARYLDRDAEYQDYLQRMERAADRLGRPPHSPYYR